MWRDQVLPKLRERGLGQPVAIRTLRLAGIGESQLADVLGELLHATNPLVATYARADAVDVRIAARPPAGNPADGRVAAEALADSTERRVLELVGRHVWARGDTSWAAAIGAEIEARGGSLAVVEYGTGGSLAALLGDAPWVAYAERHPSPAPSAHSLREAARRVASVESVPLVVAVSARPRRGDTVVTIAVLTPAGEHRERRLVFLDGAPGRTRAALAAADALLASLRSSLPARPAR
jgi:nicotinamide-nucleotide amidase